MLENTFQYICTQNLTLITQLLKKLQPLKLFSHFPHFQGQKNSKVKVTIDKNVAIQLINNLRKFENCNLKTKDKKCK